MSPMPSSEPMHPAALLLPEYVAGNLTAEERQEVDRHLTQCPDCQRELEEVRELREGVHTHFSSLPGPPPRVFERVKAQIQAEEGLVKKEKSPPLFDVSGWLSALEEGFRVLFAPRWVPGLAVALIVAQTTLLMWASISPQGELVPPVSVTERSVPPNLPTSSSVLAQIAFQDNTSEKELRMIIRDLEARIVNGPSLDGIYTVQLLEKDPALVDQKLKALLGKSGAIRMAKRISP